MARKGNNDGDCDGVKKDIQKKTDHAQQIFMQLLEGTLQFKYLTL